MGGPQRLGPWDLYLSVTTVLVFRPLPVSPEGLANGFCFCREAILSRGLASLTDPRRGVDLYLLKFLFIV